MFIYALLVAGLAILLGLAFNYLGYKLFLILLPIWGFFAGFLVGAGAMEYIVGGGLLGTLLSWIVAFFVGLVVAVLSYLFYSVGVLMLGFSFGSALSVLLMAAFGWYGGWIYFGIVIVSGFIGSIAAVALNIQKYLILAITSIGGSTGILLGILLILQRITLSNLQYGNPVKDVLNDSIFWTVVWLVLIVSGIVSQLKTSKGVEWDEASFETIYSELND